MTMRSRSLLLLVVALAGSACKPVSASPPRQPTTPAATSILASLSSDRGAVRAAILRQMYAALRLLATLAAGLVACARPTPGASPPAPPRALARATIAPDAPAPSLRVRLLPRLTPPRLGVELVAQGLVDREWSVAALVSADLRDLKVEDSGGPVPFSRRRDGAALHMTLERAPQGALQIHYTLHPESVASLPEDVPAALTLRIDESRVLASGEELLLLPTAAYAKPIALQLELVPDGPIVRLVSSLGVEPGTPSHARAGDLRHAVFLAGATGHALLRDRAGDDDFAWTGDPSFDLRWSAAETAGTRTAVDAYFGATPEEVVRFTALFSVDPDATGDVGTQVLPRGGGLYVALSPGAIWNGPTRLAVAQGLVHRWIGGRLRLGEVGEPPERGAWFGEGFARFVAREVLFDLGTLSLKEYAEEVNALQSELATAPLRRAPIAELATAAASGDSDARALLIARGALFATRVDARIRARHRGERTLRALLRGLVSEARTEQLATLPLQAFTDRLRDELGDAEVSLFRRSVLGGEALALPVDALGQCFTRGPGIYKRFELGFDAAASQPDTSGHVRGLRPGGPAARAGVREGERLLALSHAPGDPETPVELKLERDGREVTVVYAPVGAKVRGDVWRPRPNIDEVRCVR